jgi:hypothetical protein
MNVQVPYEQFKLLIELAGRAAVVVSEYNRGEYNHRLHPEVMEHLKECAERHQEYCKAFI